MTINEILKKAFDSKNRYLLLETFFNIEHLKYEEPKNFSEFMDLLDGKNEFWKKRVFLEFENAEKELV